MNDDARWMGAAIAYSQRGRGQTWPNPNVGCVIVHEGRVVGRGWTQPGGRPHAEAVAIAQAGDAAWGATLYTTLEPCAHVSERGPTCSDLIVEAGAARVVVAVRDPDVRTNGNGTALLRGAAIQVVEGVEVQSAARAMAGFLTRQRYGRPHVTLKLALSLDGCIARVDGESQWITGPEARAHGHLERSRVEAILVGRGTFEADAPRLDVRLAGLEGRSPKKYILSATRTARPEPVEGLSLSSSDGAEKKAGLRQAQPERWEVVSSPQDIATLPADHLLIEGGAGAASSFLAADLVDRLLIYRAPILIGGGKPALGDIGLTLLADAHNRWHHVDTRALGVDRLDIYERVRD
jgi:diaminohydroxyphosphoribosylaminopyrimidine deaminase / 5-amino-6-(5-phosphoribosylamino)uracil reductase